jgi:hypothetical protein
MLNSHREFVVVLDNIFLSLENAPVLTTNLVACNPQNILPCITFNLVNVFF